MAEGAPEGSAVGVGSMGGSVEIFRHAWGAVGSPHPLAATPAMADAMKKRRRARMAARALASSSSSSPMVPEEYHAALVKCSSRARMVPPRGEAKVEADPAA